MSLHHFQALNPYYLDLFKFLRALYYIGYAGTPVIGSLSASGAFFSSKLSNYYPAPAYILAVVHAVAILALVTYFAEADEIQRQGQAVESHPSKAVSTNKQRDHECISVDGN